MTYTITCPHCNYEIKRRTFGEGKCRRCGAPYWMSGNDASFGKPNRTAHECWDAEAMIGVQHNRIAQLERELREERDRLDLACDLLSDYVSSFPPTVTKCGPDWDMAWNAVEEIKESQKTRKG